MPPNASFHVADLLDLQEIAHHLPHEVVVVDNEGWLNPEQVRAMGAKGATPV